MTAVGVDWAAGRWVTVAYGEDVDARDPPENVAVSTEPSLLNVWHEHRDADRILVDVPVGLPGPDADPESLVEGYRRCDRLARERLPASLRSSVFRVPCRSAVYAEDYETAREHNREHLGAGLSAQSWGIVPRIREADVFFDDCPLARDAVAESHPEVCFAALADGRDLARKDDPEGVADRVGVLALEDEALAEAFRRVEDRAADGTWKRRITTTRTGDVLDAMVLALTAARDRTETLPADPPRDGHDLPMRIVVPET